MSKPTSLRESPDSRRATVGAMECSRIRTWKIPMQRHDKSNSAPHSIRKNLRSSKGAYFTKTIADVEERSPTERDERIRTIGKRAYRLGGIKLMHEVFWRLDRQGIKVGYRWDGIGGWWK